MIKLNDLLERTHKVMVERFRANEDTSMKAWLLYLSRLWREADESIHDKECSKYVYSRTELVLADMILLIMAILHHLGVKNIENLLRRRLDDNDRDNKMKLKK